MPAGETTVWDRRLRQMQDMGRATGHSGLKEPLALLGLVHVRRRLGLDAGESALLATETIEHVADTVGQIDSGEHAVRDYLFSAIARVDPAVLSKWLAIAARNASDPGFREWFPARLDDLDLPARHETPAAVAQLMVSLFGDGTDRSVLDPACNSGGLLAAAARRLESDRTRLTGRESDGEAYAWARLRFAVQASRNVTLARANLVTDKDGQTPAMPERFDMILTNPPFGLPCEISGVPWLAWGSELLPDNLPARISSEAAYVLAAFRKLSETGAAAIVVPNGFLTRGGIDRRIRQALVTRGAVSAVIGLPARLFVPGTAIETSILLLRGTGGPQDDPGILFVDARGLGHRQGAKTVLRDEAVEQVAGIVRERRSRQGLSRIVPGSTLEEEDYALVPALYVKRAGAERKTAADRRARIRELEERHASLVRQYEALRSQLAGDRTTTP